MLQIEDSWPTCFHFFPSSDSFLKAYEWKVHGQLKKNRRKHLLIWLHRILQPRFSSFKRWAIGLFICIRNFMRRMGERKLICCWWKCNTMSFLHAVRQLNFILVKLYFVPKGKTRLHRHSNTLSRCGMVCTFEFLFRKIKINFSDWKSLIKIRFLFFFWPFWCLDILMQNLVNKKIYKK